MSGTVVIHCRILHIAGKRYKDQSLLSVPIVVRDDIVGVINVNNKRSGESFDLEDQNLLVAIANQVALAMENFELVNSLRIQAATLERTNDELVRMNRARTRLVCNLSHELKTALAHDQATPWLLYKTVFMIFYDSSTRTRN